jgi:hypothetical protein
MINYCIAAGCEVEIAGEASLSTTSFTLYVDGKPVVVDFSDYDSVIPNLSTPCLKFHCSENTLRTNPTIKVFPPVSFYSWKEYDILSKCITYGCNSDLILNRQRPYGGALDRRNMVQQSLRDLYGNKVQTCLVSQAEYWQEINSCLVAVFVPGARNDMIDRGQLQYMAFGCCTISPKLNDILPGNQKIEAGIHYIQCKDDYSDLSSQIEFVRHNRDLAIVIGSNAKLLFQNSCIPKLLDVSWK